MTASDYSVGFGFKGQDGEFYGTNGSVGLYHLGNDLYCPMNTDLTIQGVHLGLTGKSGMVGGPHLHVAKWQAGNVSGGYYISTYKRSYFDPSDVWQQTGTVSEVGGNNPQAGNFIRVAADNGFTYEFFHLSRIDINVGDKIEGDDMETITILQSALNDARKNVEIFESALNAQKQLTGTFESALNAEREKTKELEKQLADQSKGTELKTGKYYIT